VASPDAGEFPTEGVYPNPARDEVHVNWPEQARTLSVQDASGREVQRINVTNPGHRVLPAAEWPRGTVLLVWMDADGGMCGTSRLLLE
jgi:hypothetical protein